VTSLIGANGPGSYTVTVTAKGDGGIVWYDGPVSDPSSELVVAP
jgi:hypothetical protein